MGILDIVEKIPGIGHGIRAAKKSYCYKGWIGIVSILVIVVAVVLHQVVKVTAWAYIPTYILGGLLALMSIVSYMSWGYSYYQLAWITNPDEVLCDTDFMRKATSDPNAQLYPPPPPPVQYTAPVQYTPPPAPPVQYTTPGQYSAPQTTVVDQYGIPPPSTVPPPPPILQSVPSVPPEAYRTPSELQTSLGEMQKTDMGYVGAPVRVDVQGGDGISGGIFTI